MDRGPSAGRGFPNVFVPRDLQLDFRHVAVADQSSRRLEVGWLAGWKLIGEDEQRIATEKLAERLDNNPALVILQLKMTPHGCDWIMDCWRRIAATLECVGKFNVLE